MPATDSAAARLLDPAEVRPSPVALLLLGRGSDPLSEKGVRCPGDLPAASDPALVERARAAKAALGDRVFVLGHHYQRDEVIQFADVTGDSFRLAQQAAARPEAEYIVFCGVHFMAESADILTGPAPEGPPAGPRRRLLHGRHGRPSTRSRTCWEVLTAAGVADVTVPVTYMNSSAAIKAFTGRHGGTVCTSSNAERALDWAFERGEKVLFLPDQHLGRNTAVRELGLSLDDCVVFDPHRPDGGLTAEQLEAATMILWRGHCSVHGRFTLRQRPARSASGCPASPSWCTRSAGTRWSARPTWSARPSSSSGRSPRPRPAAPSPSAPS